MYRVSKWRGVDPFSLSQISNRLRQFQDAMVRPRRKIELGHRGPHQTLTLRHSQREFC